MVLTELSLAPSNNNTSGKKKRKLLEDDYLISMEINEAQSLGTSHVDLQLDKPLPLDWEQCLDLKSGQVYYLNRETSKKSWKLPLREDLVEEHDLDLELHISSNFPGHASFSEQRCCEKSSKKVTAEEVVIGDGGSGDDVMLALACMNCHLLVVLSKSSPCCPKCKYIHSFPFPSDIIMPQSQLKSWPSI